MSRLPSKADKLHARRIAYWLGKNLEVTEGPLAGQPFKVLPFQRRFIRGLVANPQAALSMGRGNGKTTLAAALAVAAFAGPMSAPRGMVILAAASLRQARIGFHHALWFLRCLGMDKKRLRINDHTQECRIVDKENGNSLMAIGSNPNKAHGHAPVLMVADEPAQWDSNVSARMYAALMTALGKHEMGRFVAIGTRPDDHNHWFARMLTGDQPGIYAQMHAAKNGSSDFAMKSIAAANPALRHMPALGEVIHFEKEAAVHGGENLDRWRALRLNRGTPDVGDHDKIVKLEDWSACVVGASDLPAKSGPVAIGFDLGGSASMSCFAVYSPETGRFEVTGAFPADPNLGTRGKQDFVGNRYLLMQQRKELRTYPGKVTPVAMFLTDMARRIEEWEVIGAAADAYRKSEAEQALSVAGIKWDVEWRRVGAGKDGSADIRAFQAEILEPHLRTNRSLLMDSAIHECRINYDTNGNPRMDRSRLRGRIDALQAAVIAVGLGRRWRLPSSDGKITLSADDLILSY